MAFLVATTSLPAVYRPNDDRWNAARSCQLLLISLNSGYTNQYLGCQKMGNRRAGSELNFRRPLRGKNNKTNGAQSYLRNN